MALPISLLAFLLRLLSPASLLPVSLPIWIPSFPISASFSW